ncbi:tyrosine-protein phosphatase, partial [Bacteroides sp. OttesenSCG-928-F21]|nr:tyrosine-protein phosphatase [Bacteroides sp. OttesenSCG-928-F21]
MHKGLFGLFSIILLVSSCSGESLNISVVCEENSVGNCIIKWETTPLIEGKVKIYASTHPEKIPEAVPVSIANISDQRIVIVPADPTKRYYYKMVFNNRHRVVTATRNINIPGIQNVRDLGGYSANKGKTVRYGKVFRSGEFDHLSSSAYTELKNIGIKTIVDLRDPKEVSTVNSGLKTKEFNVIQIPIGIINAHEIIRELVKGEVRNDSIHRLVLRMNRELVTYYRAEYKQLFDVLLEKKNYPVMIHCTSGKGRTAIASSLLFAALGVSYDSAMHD